jgi:hypothetical protein
VDNYIVPPLSNLRTPVTELPSGHAALHANVFCLDDVVDKHRPKEWSEAFLLFEENDRMPALFISLLA